jgi:uncharacterized protein
VAEEVARIDLRALGLAPGASVRMRVAVPPIELRIAGQDYLTDPASPEADVEVVRSLSGLHLRLRMETDLVGPCWRCVEDARVPVRVDTSEYIDESRPDDVPVEEGMDSEYVEGQLLDLALWARDAVAEVVPAVVLCREDCAGLCPTCGANHNLGPCDCVVEAVDPRWDALRELSERLSGDPGTN